MQVDRYQLLSFSCFFLPGEGEIMSDEDLQEKLKWHQKQSDLGIGKYISTDRRGGTYNL